MATVTVLVAFVGVETEPPGSAFTAIFVRLVVDWGLEGTRSVEADVTDSGERVELIARPVASAML